jgi:hypothetical protein
MIDPLQLPILMKAIDFVFDEGRKILEERRERRKAESAAPEAEAPKDEKEIVPLEPEKAEEIKKDLITSKIDELLWQSHEAEVKHLVTLLETHSRNYRIAREQYAKWGSALVPPIIVHNMTEAENAVADTLGRLEAVLSRVYKKDIQSTQ